MIDLKELLSKVLDLENTGWSSVDDRLKNEGGIILNEKNITELEKLIEDEIDKQDSERRSSHVCSMGDPVCNARGSCNGSC